MTKSLACLLAVLLALWPTTAVWAQSGGNCSIFKSWGTTETLTASDLNTSFTTVGVTNATQACIDGISDSLANMQTETTPYTAGAESLATSGAGELQRLRYVLSSVFGFANWYRRDQNVDLATGTEIQGSGLGRHITAVGLHTWSGSNLWPAITSVATHTTGLLWGQPGALNVGGVAVEHHLTLMFDATSDSGRFGSGQTNARSWFAFHAAALTLHHTAALRFFHSEGMMDRGQRGHVTALQIHRGLPGQTGASDANSKNDAAYKDSIVLGHATVGLMIHGTGIVGGANRLYGLSDDGRYMETKTISGSGITISHQAGQIVFSPTASAGALPSYTLRPEGATFGAHNDTGAGFPALVKHALAFNSSYALEYLAGAPSGTQIGNQTAHWYVALPDGTSYTGASITIFSRQTTRTTGAVGWHVLTRLVSHATAWQGSYTVNTVYPQNVNGTANAVTAQSEHLTTTGLSTAKGDQILQIGITRLIQPSANNTFSVSEPTEFVQAVIRMR